MPKKQAGHTPLELFALEEVVQLPSQISDFLDQVRQFQEFGRETETTIVDSVDTAPIPYCVNEFWTAKQRDAAPIHEVSYRACFKPQLPAFFIERLTQLGDTVHDPFLGRGTTALETALLSRTASGCDINPLSAILTEPRLSPPTLDAVRERLDALDLDSFTGPLEDFLLPFYHPRTARQIHALRGYLLEKRESDTADIVDQWIQMVATNRLTGHSPGFFSVYTMPPNQAVSAQRQSLINEKRHQRPQAKDVKAIILKKSTTLMKGDQVPRGNTHRSTIRTASADDAGHLQNKSVSLVVTSPPFIDVVDYKGDNWLRCWFNGIDPNAVAFWQFKKIEDWSRAMVATLKEMHRILKPGGVVAFEVGEVRKGKVLLEQELLPHIHETGLTPLMVMVNQQDFTKTSNTWGVNNLSAGTNTNRILILYRS